MAFRGISMNEIREVLRLWLGTAALPAPGLRTIVEHAGVDRKTVRRYVEAAQAAGLTRTDDADAVSDEVIATVVATVRPDRPHGHGAAWEQLVPHQEQITKWVSGDGERKPLTIAKIEVLLDRKGCRASNMDFSSGRFCDDGRVPDRADIAPRSAPPTHVDALQWPRVRYRREGTHT